MVARYAETEAELLQSAIAYLARRDYAAKELRLKLSRRLNADNEQAEQWLDTVMQRLQERGYQSDERYIEMLIRARTERGYGPQFIRQYLQQYQLDSSLLDSYLDPSDHEWKHRALHQLIRKFRQPGHDPKSRQKQQRYLYQRGFTTDQIRWAIARFGDADTEHR